LLASLATPSRHTAMMLTRAAEFGKNQSTARGGQTTHY